MQQALSVKIHFFLILQGDVRDYEAVLKACEGADCVFHVAACGMSGLEQASTIFLTFSFFILVKEKICLHTEVREYG